MPQQIRIPIASLTTERTEDPARPAQLRVPRATLTRSPSPPSAPSLLRRLGRGALRVISPIPAVQRAARRGATRLEGVERPDQPEGSVFDIPAAVRAIPDVVRGLIRHPIATLRGGAAGMVEGLGDIASPLDVASLGTAGALRAVRPMAQAVRTARTVEDVTSDVAREARRWRVRQAVRAVDEAPVTRPRASLAAQPANAPVARIRVPISSVARGRVGRFQDAPATSSGPSTAAELGTERVASTVPAQHPIPASRLQTFPSIQKMPAPIRGDITELLHKHQGFEAQRRGVQSVVRTEALADRLDVPLDTLVKPGTALNAEELASYKNAIASVMTTRAPLADAIRTGTASDVDKLQFSRYRIKKASNCGIGKTQKSPRRD